MLILQAGAVIVVFLPPKLICPVKVQFEPILLHNNFLSILTALHFVIYVSFGNLWTVSVSLFSSPVCLALY